MAKRRNKEVTPANLSAAQWRNRIVGSGFEDAEQLCANPRNWRIHPGEQQAALAGVLDKVGWVQNVVVNQRTGFVVDGHLRVQLAISAGEKVPVLYVDLSEEEEALILATIDPLSAMAVRDAQLLHELTESIRESELGQDLGESLDSLLEKIEAGDLGPGSDDPSLVPPVDPEADEEHELPSDPVSAPGDLWLCGQHRVLCGDSTAEDSVSRLLSGQKAPFLMVTDPPYGVEYDPEWRDEAAKHCSSMGNRKNTAKGKVSNDDQCDWSAAWALFPGDVAYVWHAGVFAGDVALSLLKTSFHVRAQIIWAKSHIVIGRGAYHWKHEPCWYAVRKGKSAHWCGDRTQSTIWDIAKPQKSETGHGTQKPIELMRRPIINHTTTGEAVYDPFLGSGTTLIAAELTGRICFGIDIDPRYVDVIVQRWEKQTGKQATLESDGRTFDEIKSERLTVAA